MTKRKRRASFWVWDCVCERCGHKWQSIGEKAPAKCSACKSKYWEHPRGTLKMGRPKKKPKKKA